MKKAFINKLYILQYSVIAFMLLCMPHWVIGQKNLKYKDVYKVVTEKSKEEAYSLLLVYQKQEPYFANTYIQLGLLAQYWSKDYDALTNLRDVEFFIYNTGLYFGLANSKIDSKEIRRNDKYYLNIDRFRNFEKLEEEEVKAYIQEQLVANSEYKKNVYIVTNFFSSSIKHYNKCITIFKEINTNNNKIKDIYLTAGPGFTNQLNELESSFDSTIYYLQNYQTAIKNYPIKDYNPKYKLLPIETYRLQGLTGSDFLQNEISIWDYATWVKNVKHVLNRDISELRQAINKADKQLNKNTNSLSETQEFKLDFELPEIDKRLKYKIGKFDHKSILLDLINYKESKIDFLAFSKTPINNPEDTLTEYTLMQKARYYERLVNKKQVCDSLSKNFSSRINPYDLSKYNDFFTNNYGGEAGLKNYAKNELAFLESKLKISFNNFKKYLIETSKTGNKFGNITYKNETIELKKSIPDFEKAKPGKYYTIDFQENASGDYYITGFTKKKNNKLQAFIAKSNSSNGIKWLKVLPLSKSGISVGSFLQIKDEGCEVLFNLISNELITSQIITFDEAGKQKGKFELKINGFPRYFNYDEINQQYLLVFKGNKLEPLDCLGDELIITQIDANTKVAKWQKNINVKGQFVDIVKMNQEVFVFVNFTKYQSATNTYTSNAGTGPNNTNTILIALDETGSVKKETPFLNSAAFFTAKAIKINSNTINLVGFKTQLVNLNKTKESEFGDFLYLLLNSKGEVYFDNWK